MTGTLLSSKGKFFFSSRRDSFSFQLPVPKSVRKKKIQPDDSNNQEYSDTPRAAIA